MSEAWEHMMGEARKRKRSVETIGDSSTPQGLRKRAKGPGEVVLRDKSRDIYRHFQSTYQMEFSQATFLGICAYLHTLIQWGYPISSPAFDGFICSHSTFVDDLEVMVAQRGCTPSYHHWFTEHQLHQSRPGSVLDGGSLHDIAAEHPYTFAQTEASMELMAKKVRDRESCRA